MQDSLDCVQAQGRGAWTSLHSDVWVASQPLWSAVDASLVLTLGPLRMDDGTIEKVPRIQMPTHKHLIHFHDFAY